MQKLNPVALGGTFAIIDLVLHPLFHLWVAVSPRSYERLMNVFVAGLHLQVTEFDTSITHLILGTVLEAAAFGALGFVAASLYNWLHRA
ncbi:MAG: hypothetical protein Q7R81_01515 [Candidatus Peregrinibacteria bacterium]|nr:hypothetical protein [Candidatus Peregrinibacteria bacterium]